MNVNILILILLTAGVPACDYVYFKKRQRKKNNKSFDEEVLSNLFQLIEAHAEMKNEVWAEFYVFKRHLNIVTRCNSELLNDFSEPTKKEIGYEQEKRS